MTDEQIKQNAEEYAKKHYYIPFEDDSSMNVIVSEESYIAGAHSRDEEIKELKEEIESLQEQYNTCFDGFTKRGTKLGELMKENVKLRNPWISVEEWLPEDDYLVLTIYWVHKDFYSIELSSYNPKTREWDCGEFGYRISHWMPIPELREE